MRIIGSNRFVLLIALLSLIFISSVDIAESYTLQGDKQKKTVVLNPYQNVDWSGYSNYKAALHVHTMQSDGRYLPEEVIMTYRKAGFKILSITDHDWNRPNHHVKHGRIPKEKASPYPLDPKPYNFPANPTWPWSDYGGPEPAALGILGIQGNELTFRHHMNSYFSDYGKWYERTGKEAPYEGITDEHGNEIFEDDQLFDIKEKRGLAIINHPGVPDDRSWWDRKPLDWYVERFRNHSPDYLVGIEVTNTQGESEKYDEGLWDQLLARFMPERPIWGFGNDDMHELESVRDTYTVFILDSLTEKSVRDAMRNGQFLFCKSSRRINLKENEVSVFPKVEKIKVNQRRGVIHIKASDYDVIRWISAPDSLEEMDDYRTSNQPWSSGQIVYEGSIIRIRKLPDIKNYVRAELIRKVGDVTYRTFTNPFGVATVYQLQN